MSITAFLIDPTDKRLTLLKEFDCSLQNLYERMNCKQVGVFYHDNHCFYYDDEHDIEEAKEFWRLTDFESWVAGKAIVVSEQTTKDGDSLSADENYGLSLLKKLRFGTKTIENEAA